jgi:FtsP/CotA-like multicopper oxidase with cupredoxin domain
MKSLIFITFITLAFITLALMTAPTFARTVRYELTASRGAVNLSGKKDVNFALMLNGQIPAPTLEFTEGDDAEITVRNQIPNQEVSIHWHGLLLDPYMDGVAYVNTPPIHPGESFTFKFKLRQSGTYWYHSHTNVQEQKGIFGAFIIQPRQKTTPVTKEVVAILSDWSDENATDILKNLRKDGDYYLYKKGTMRSLWGAFRAGRLGTYLHNEFTRMGGMDLSDVGYDAFLVNGKRDVQLVDAKPGDKVRVRIINAAASSYFYVSLGQSPLTVISADGTDVQPIKAKELLIGMAETYDILFEVPEAKNYELSVRAQDGTGAASGWIGAGEKVRAPVKPAPDLYAPMDHGAHGGGSGHAGHSGQGGHGGHEHEGHPAPVTILTVDDLRALAPTGFSAKARTHDVRLELGGDMERYVWYINGKAIHEDRTIEIHEGDVVRFHLVNATMMHHPIHLHGHFFRVLNESEEFSPLKHTVDVPPHAERTIEFLANEPGDWMLHCHNLYHMKTGMARVVSYSSFKPRWEIENLRRHDPHLHDHIYHSGLLEAATNHAQATMRFTRTWDMIDARIEARDEHGEGDKWDWEGDVFYRRYFSQFFNVLIGGSNVHEENHGAAGIGYTLPMLIETQLIVDHEGDLRLDLGKKLQWTRSVFSQVEVTFREKMKTEYEVSLMYGPSWNWSGGLMLTEQRLGAGLEYRF